MAQLNIRQRPSGKWEYRFEAGTVDGKRKQISKGGFKTKKEASIAGTKALDEYNDTGKCFVPSETTYADFLDFWLKNYCSINLKHTTFERHEKRIKNHIKPALGKYKLKALTPFIIQSFINEKFNDGYSRNTLATFKGIISGSLDYAVQNEQIKTNPAWNIKLPSGRAKAATPTRTKARIAITAEQMQIILNRFPEGHPCYLPLILAYRCGLRLGEVFGLMEQDFNPDNNTLRIERQIQWDSREKAWIFSNPKYDSFRTIELDSVVSELLIKLIIQQKEARTYYDDLYTKLYINEKEHLIQIGPNAPAPEGVESMNLKEIFLLNRREDGTYIQTRVLQRCFHVIHSDLGMPDLDFHSLRHTHSTMLLDAGVPFPLIQQRLGHATLKMTEHYSNHVTDNMVNMLLHALHDDTTH